MIIFIFVLATFFKIMDRQGLTKYFVRHNIFGIWNGTRGIIIFLLLNRHGYQVSECRD